MRGDIIGDLLECHSVGTGGNEGLKFSVRIDLRNTSGPVQAAMLDDRQITGRQVVNSLPENSFANMIKSDFGSLQAPDCNAHIGNCLIDF